MHDTPALEEEPTPHAYQVDRSQNFLVLFAAVGVGVFAALRPRGQSTEVSRWALLLSHSELKCRIPHARLRGARRTALMLGVSARACRVDDLADDLQVIKVTGQGESRPVA